MSDDEDESKKDSINIYMSNSIVWAASDHVCVIYDQWCSHYLNNRSKNQKRFKIKVEAMEAAVACQRDVGLKGLGVSLINTSAYHSFRKHINTTKHRNFVQEMSTSADHSFIQRIKTSADHQLHSANKILSISQLHSTNGSIWYYVFHSNASYYLVDILLVVKKHSLL